VGKVSKATASHRINVVVALAEAALGATKGGQIAGPGYVAAGSQSAKAPKSTVPSPRRKRL